MTVNTKALGERIKAARNRMEIGQEKLASLAVVEPSHISNLESGNERPSLAVLCSISKALSVRNDELLCDSVLKSGRVFRWEIMDTLEDCSANEQRQLLYILKWYKATLRMDEDYTEAIKLLERKKWNGKKERGTEAADAGGEERDGKTDQDSQNQGGHDSGNAG